jgi:hypothetical protein
MKRILYASGGFLTHDAIAEALMDYASVLAIVNSSDVVECQGIDEQGLVRDIKMLIGPASQIMAMQTDDEAVDMYVEKTVAELRRRSAVRLPDYTRVGETPPSSTAETDAESTRPGSN